MTEQVNETKSAEEQLADIVKAEAGAIAETKADAASFEELKSFAEAMKAELEEHKGQQLDLEAVKAATLELIETKLNALPAAPAVQKGETPLSVFKLDGERRDMIEKSVEIFKAELTPNNSGDSPVGSSPVWTVATEANPFRGIANVFAVNSASFKTFEVTSVDANKNQNAGSQTEAGAVANDTINVNDYNSLTRMNENLVDDLPGLDNMVGMEQARKVMLEEHKDIVAVLDAATVTEVDADISDGDLSTLTPYQSLIASLPNVNWSMASWVMSPEAYTDLLNANHSGTGSPLAIDPISGGFTLYGRRIYVSGEMDSGATAGDNPVYFGDFSRALWIGSRQDLNFRRSFDNTIGAITYYTNMRSGQAVVDASAIRRLNMIA